MLTRATTPHPFHQQNMRIHTNVDKMRSGRGNWLARSYNRNMNAHTLRRRGLLLGLVATWTGGNIGCGGDESSPSPAGTGGTSGAAGGNNTGGSSSGAGGSDAGGSGGDNAGGTSANGGAGGSKSEGDYFPPNDSDDWETADPVATGWSPDGLTALLDLVEQNKSSSFMMLVNGRVLVEEYFMGAKAQTRTDVASVQKSFTSTLLGLARDKGLLKFDDFVSSYLAPGWSNATTEQEAQITLLHLMTHASGLSPNTLNYATPPGTAFDYNTPAYQKLRLVLEKASGLDINALSKQWLFDAIGVGGEWAPRDNQDPTGATIWGLELSARDMARFGLFAQHTGVWAGTPITKDGWFAEAWTPCAVRKDYGLLWWLQGKGGLGAKGAPADLVSALGARDQKIYVVPSLKLVVTRQGLAAGTESEAESDFDLVLLKAIADARA